MSRSNKKSSHKVSIKRDIRKIKNRGFRRHVKLAIKDGQWEEGLPEAPRKIRPLGDDNFIEN